MKDNYSSAKREQYGCRLAAHLCNQHFLAQPDATLDGPAVLQFTPIRQINLFVVQQLLGQWTQEMARLRSPYFDFEAADVRQALTQFMNVLSRRIKLSRATFEPLLATAVSDTLGIATDAEQIFEGKILGTTPSVTVEQLRDALRYIDVDKAWFQTFIDSLVTGAPLERSFVLERFRQYQQANHARQRPLDKLVEELSNLLPLTAADLREDGPVAEAPARPVTPVPMPVAPVAPTPAPAVTPPVAPPALPTLTGATEGPAGRLYDKLKSEQPAPASLSATLRPERGAATLAEKPTKVESLREAISINQRFSFINELFSGENMEYHAAIQHLDTLPDADAAKRYVTETLAKSHDWTRKEEHVGRLLKLIDRKFA
ncbi:hypothetical protein MUN82_14950 [Hymenobacter aerilatus]|uniref:Uncharacterized protein n=1 Tax=Hymenobacter aerilatus TaxID=2932251 RepID=A0A8T9SR66_9BACT|nr:hypothetical protein [Hymenobacter aerilatus]UOR04237.1 hypothetical protein MUN82_14950 [Hymenobacter aerilatus]